MVETSEAAAVAVTGTPMEAPVADETVSSDLDSADEGLWAYLVGNSELPRVEGIPDLLPTASLPRSHDSATASAPDQLSPPARSGLSAPPPPSSLSALIDRLEVESSDLGVVHEIAAAPDQAHETNLFNCDNDEGDLPCRQRSRLRRGDENSAMHPPLLQPPVRHPTTNHINHYDPSAPWGYDAEAPIVRLLDVHGEEPHRCYLVEWKGRPMQCLDNATTRSMMALVDDWKASGDSRSFMEWEKPRDLASEAGTCFMDAFRSALYYLGQPGLVTMEMWDAFEVSRPASIRYGVSCEDVTEFFKSLQRQSVPLNYDLLLTNVNTQSNGDVQTLSEFFRSLVPGVYLVSAGEDDVGHCFVVIWNGPGRRLLALDDYDVSRDPPMVVLPLSFQQWIKHVKWICRVELQLDYVCRGKRKSKAQKQREKRLRQEQQ
ncbi:unnamed protein product [Phytophthora fragariaefolia]|uniref:Unnamed protein product n=1 Tax=Phytophthora fragariaefolia TaxID=1490495 RepID=A0A9W6YQQ2_9STRA|nr:unnamed protein product [Phytophthora fragariaefolia]